MNKSENIGQLAKAMSLIQGEVTDLKKDKKAYAHKYGDLPQLLQILRPLLLKNNMAVMQFPGLNEDRVVLETIVSHESGEWISRVMEAPITIGKGMIPAQAVGATITYTRRYALLSIFCIGAEDEDDDLSSIAKSSGSLKQEALSDAYAKKQMMEHLNELLKKDENPSETISKICSFYKVASLDDLSSTQLGEVMKNLKKRLLTEAQKVNECQQEIKESQTHIMDK